MFAGEPASSRTRRKALARVRETVLEEDSSDAEQIFTHSCIVSLILAGLAATGCQKKPAAAAGPAMQGLPVQTVTVAMQPVPQSSEYVATIKSRRSATMSPQVSGQLTEILVHSGEQVKAGQVLMLIDPRQQQANVAALLATERQKKAVYDYDTIELDRQNTAL